MKRRVSDILISVLTFVVLLLLAVVLLVVGVDTLNAFAVSGDALLLQKLATWSVENPQVAGIALIGVAVLLAILGEECLSRILPRRAAGQRGYVMQKNENGAIGVSIRAIEGLIRTCVDKHEAIAQAEIQVEEFRDGIVIFLHIIQAAGVNIPLSVGALQKQIKQYVTACTGVDVYRIRVMVENDESIPVAPGQTVQDVAPLPQLSEVKEEPAALPSVQGVVVPPVEEEQKPPIPAMPMEENDVTDDRPLHQRLFGMPEQPMIIPTPPMKAEETGAETPADPDTLVVPDAPAVSDAPDIPEIALDMPQDKQMEAEETQASEEEAK